MWSAAGSGGKLMSVVIHRGPIPGTSVGHHWFEAGGVRYGISSSPYGVNAGWAYDVQDEDGLSVDDSMFRFDEIREWAERINVLDAAFVEREQSAP